MTELAPYIEESAQNDTHHSFQIEHHMRLMHMVAQIKPNHAI